jgi:hypothetical protein
MTAMQAAELVLSLAVGVDPGDMPRLAAWLASEADERTVLRHLLEARYVDPIDVLRARTITEFRARREAQMDQLVDAAVALLARFRVPAEREARTVDDLTEELADIRERAEYYAGERARLQQKLAAVASRADEILDGAAFEIRRVLGEDQR